MRNIRITICLLAAGGALLGGVAGRADDKNKNLDKPKKVVERVTPAQPPKASNTQKPSPVGQRVTSTSKEPGYKPQQKSPESKKIVVPPPGK